jgi:hypothetical protein
MSKRKRVLAASILALAVSGIVAGAAVGATTGWNGSATGWSAHRVLASEDPGTAAIPNVTAIEY